MKKSNKKGEDIVHEFWSKYIDGDIIEREKIIDKIMIENIDNTRLIDNYKIRRHCIKLTLMGYFDDLIDTMYQKQREDGFRK